MLLARMVDRMVARGVVRVPVDVGATLGVRQWPWKKVGDRVWDY